MNNDRYQTPLTAQYQITTTGWHSIPITSLDQLHLNVGRDLKIPFDKK